MSYVTEDLLSPFSGLRGARVKRLQTSNLPPNESVEKFEESAPAIRSNSTESNPVNSSIEFANLGLNEPKAIISQFRFFEETPRWTNTATNGSGLVQGDPTTLTWSLIADGTSIDGFVGEGRSDSAFFAYLNGIYGSQATWLPILESVFDRWSELSGLNYVYEPNDDGADFGAFSTPGVLGVRGDIRIGGHRIDGDGGTLAYNFNPGFGEMVIDTTDTYFENTNNDSIRLRNTLAHELAHGLGLEHVESNDGSFLLEPFISLSFDGPQLDDLLAVHRQYGDAYESANGLPTESNDSIASAYELGTANSTTPLSIGTDASDDTSEITPTQTDFISIDDNSDIDVFQFTILHPSEINIELNPMGATYNEALLGENQTALNTKALNDLSLALLNSNGLELAAADDTTIGFGEIISELQLATPGNYYIQVSGADDNVQLYELDLTVLNSFPTATPIGLNTAEFTTDEHTSFNTGNVLSNDVDPDLDPLSILSFDVSNTLGIVTNNGDGTFFYNPNGQYDSLNDEETATDTFFYTISDGNGGTDTATVTINIIGSSGIQANGGDESDLLIGGEGNDTLSGNEGSDRIFGRNGDDSLHGGTANDILRGEAGNDTIDGGEGTDRLQAFADSDFIATNETLTGQGIDSIANIEILQLIGGESNNSINASTLTTARAYLYGRDGDDTLIGGTANDILRGEEGNDTIDGGEGIDRLQEFADSDFIVTNKTLTGQGIDSIANIEIIQLFGGESNNSINASTLTVTRTYLYGRDGDDTLLGGAANDNLRGESGNDSLIGGAANDILRGGSGNDTLDGGEGMDRLQEIGDIDFVAVDGVLTGQGTDNVSHIEIMQLIGGNSDNTIDASAITNARAFLFGREGNDSLIGGASNDILRGDSGEDLLIGNLGNDRYYLGSEDGVTDTIQYSVGDGVDTVFDFAIGTDGDVIDFSGITSIDIVTTGLNTEFRAAHHNFGAGGLLLTINEISNLTPSIINNHFTGSIFNLEVSE